MSETVGDKRVTPQYEYSRAKAEVAGLNRT